MDASHRKIFISYSRNDYVDKNEKIIPDSPIVKILERLDSERIERWIDLEGKYAGHSFVTEIISAIEQSDILVFISSKESNLSEYTPRELNVAIENKILIIPVRIDDTPFSKVVSFYLPGHIDRIEYYKNTETGLDKLVNNIKSEFKRLDDLERQRQKEEEDKRKEEEERKRREAEEAAEKERIAAEKAKEEQRIAAISKEITQLKTRIKERINKDKKDLPRLISLERELDTAYETDNLCPVCGVAKENKDFCETCGWFFRTAAERLITQKKNHYIERLDYSIKIWKQKEENDETLGRIRSLEVDLTQKIQLIDSLKSQCESLKNEKQTNDKELTKSKSLITELQKRNDQLLKECKEIKDNIQNGLISKSKLEQELKKTKEEALKKTKQFETKITNLQNKLTELQKDKNNLKRNENSRRNSPNDIAYLLTEEYGQYGIYCLCEGVNTFGSIAKQSNTRENYQMIVAACPELQPNHFTLSITREDKKVSILLEPISSDCVVCLNNKSRKIKSATNINVNDVIYVGDLKLYIIDNFNK